MSEKLQGAVFEGERWIKANEAEAALEENTRLINHQVLKIARMATELAVRGVRIEELERLLRHRTITVEPCLRCEGFKAQVPQWVSVDNLHPKETPLMVLTCDEIQLIGIYHCGYSNWRDCYGRELQHVTHWAYPPILPTPPKGAGDAKD